MSHRPLAFPGLLLASACLGCSGAPTAATHDPCIDRVGRTVPAVLGHANGIALGCDRVQGPSRLLELYAIRDAGGPCIVISGLEGGPRACGRAPSERVPAVHRPISAGPIVRHSRASPVEIYGVTSAAVARVILRYGLPGAGRGTSPAKLIEAGDADALEAAGIKEPFGYFVGTVPAAARWVVADAQDATGRRLGSADFTALMKDGHPQTVFIAERR